MITGEFVGNTQRKISQTVGILNGSSNDLIRRRALECFALTMIGDGVLGFVEPKRHVQLWLRGPKVWQSMLQPFVDNPDLTRWIGAAEVAAGIWLALRQAPAE
jgi:hypothetical protein